MSDMPQRPSHRYLLFGLQLDSDFPLPELFEGVADCPADVTIESGPVPVEGIFEPGDHAVPGGSLLVVEDAAHYFVQGGSRIVVQRSEGAAERNVRLFLLGSAFGLLIHQRRLLPLHANAVEIEGRIVAFMGESGVGKSTLAAWFADRGFALIADDVAVVDFGSGQPMILPGLPRLRLWEQVIEATGRNPSDFALSFEGDPTYDKRDVLLPSEKVASEPRELGAIVLLGREGASFEPVLGAAAAEAVVSNTYRGAYVRTLRTVRDHWELCTRLVQKVPVYRATVDFNLHDLDRSYEPLLSDVRAVLSKR
jgi:hypothetical protein